MSNNPASDKATALILLKSGDVFYGRGAGATGAATGEICFNTAMSGYQEILTDPSYAQQIITFTFPHIGNIGTNDEDTETALKGRRLGAVGCVLRAPITSPSNFRSQAPFHNWLKANNIVGITGLDTRALTVKIRQFGMADGIIAHHRDGIFDLDALKKQLNAFNGLEGVDLATTMSTDETYHWTEPLWGDKGDKQEKYHIVAIDCGIKSNILRHFTSRGAKVTVVNAQTPAHDILALNPDGIFISNGPADPKATSDKILPTLQALMARNMPIFGICLGHQLLALALGAQTVKMHQGHHGANHPVKDLNTAKVEITSMNHGFAVDADSLPQGVEQTHISLFDGSNCGIRVKGKPIFSVQYHPEASPGPHDSAYLFDQFLDLIKNHTGATKALK